MLGQLWETLGQSCMGNSGKRLGNHAWATLANAWATMYGQLWQMLGQPCLGNSGKCLGNHAWATLVNAWANMQPDKSMIDGQGLKKRYPPRAEEAGCGQVIEVLPKHQQKADQVDHNPCFSVPFLWLARLIIITLSGCLIGQERVFEGSSRSGWSVEGRADQKNRSIIWIFYS